MPNRPRRPAPTPKRATGTILRNTSRRLVPLVGRCALLITAACVGEVEHLHAKGNLLLRQGGVASALQCFRGAAQRDGDAVNLLRLGHVLFRAQRFSEAEAAYAKARGGVAEPCEVERPLAQLLAQMGRVAEAETALFACLTRRPDDLDARQALGLMRLDRGDLASAAAAFDDVLARHSQHAAALYARGRVALHEGQLAQAETYFARLERHHPRKPYGSYGRALVASRRRNSADACLFLDRASKLGLGKNGQDYLRRDRQMAAFGSLPCSHLASGGRG